MKNKRLLLLTGVVASLAAIVPAQSGTQTGSQPSAHPQPKNEYASKSGGPHVCLAEDLTGMSVVSPQGEKLGKIEDVVIHPGGEVAYAVLSFGGFLGMGDKLFAIPWSALRLDPDEHCFRLNVSKEQLKNAPGFDKDAWPSMADQAWAEQVHSYYRAIPYWD